MSPPLFGTREIYDALAEKLNDDPKWLEKATVLNYTMTHVYSEPLNKTFTFRFEGGKLLDIEERDGPAPADFVLSATPEVWERILVAQTLSPNVALVTRKLHVDGSMTTLLKHISVFNYLLNVLTSLDPVMTRDEA